MPQITVGTVAVRIPTVPGGSVCIQNLDTQTSVQMDGLPTVATAGAAKGISIMPGGDTGFLRTSGFGIWLIASANVTVGVCAV